MRMTKPKHAPSEAQFRTICLTLDPLQVELLDLLRDETALSRSELVREAVQGYLQANDATNPDVMTRRAQRARLDRERGRVRAFVQTSGPERPRGEGKRSLRRRRRLSSCSWTTQRKADCMSENDPEHPASHADLASFTLKEAFLCP